WQLPRTRSNTMPSASASIMRKKGTSITAPVARYAARPASRSAFPCPICPLPASARHPRSVPAAIAALQSLGVKRPDLDYWRDETSHGVQQHPADGGGGVRLS